MHPPVVVGLGVLAHGWTASPFLKFGVIGLAACAGAWIAASLLLLVPGLRKIL